jgi:hypothetical protein
MFAISFNEENELYGERVFHYDKFRDFLLKNNVDEVAVSMYLVYKDAAEMEVGDVYVSTFVIATASDKCLADSSKRVQHFDFLPLSPSELLTEGSWVSSKFYSETYSSWHNY